MGTFTRSRTSWLRFTIFSPHVFVCSSILFQLEPESESWPELHARRVFRFATSCEPE